MDLSNLNSVLEQVAKDKGIDQKILVEALEAAMLSAARKVVGLEKDIEAQFNPETGSVDVFEFKTVAEQVENPDREISLEDALEHDPDSQVGDSLGFRIETEELGRIAAQSARQVVTQRVREAERENVYDEYADREGELVTGVVRRFERGSIIVDLGRAEAMLPMREQCQRESYRAGDRIQAHVIEVNKQGRGSQIILSRTSPGLLVKLFEMEVPEIYEGIVRIEAAAREPGARSKIAVSSRDRDVDPVGACVGMKGSRVQAVVQELRGEKVDIVPWDEDPARFVCNALAPAEVSRVLVDEANHAMELIVPDDQLSLAIGRRGQNVRLASQLAGWRLDIVSEAKVSEIKDRAFKSLGRLEGVNDIHLQTLYNYGIRCAKDVLDADEGFLGEIPGIGLELGQKLKKDAERVVAEEAAEAQAVKAEEGRQAREAALEMFQAEAARAALGTPYERMRRVRGIGDATLEQLANASIYEVETLAELIALDKASELSGLSRERLDELRHAAGKYLSREAQGETVAESSDDAGPEDDYAPSELLNTEVPEDVAQSA